MILLVRTEGPRHGRKRWLSEITFLVLTPGPWVVMIWLVWPRRSGQPRSPMMATADRRRLGRHMPRLGKEVPHNPEIEGVLQRAPKCNPPIVGGPAVNGAGLAPGCKPFRIASGGVRERM